MNWILSVFILIVLLYIINRRRIIKNNRQRFKYIKDSWGKQKEIESFSFSLISRYFKNNTHKEKAFHIISDKIENDLDLNTVFTFIDRTTSKVGQQYLYYKLRTIQSLQKLKDFDRLVNLFTNNTNFRIQCQFHLLKLNNYNAYDLECLINDEKIEKPSYLKYVYLFAILNISLILLGLIFPLLYLFIIPVFCVNLFFHYQNKNNINYHLNGIDQLSIALKVSKELFKNELIRTHFKDTFTAKIETIKLKTEFIRFEKNVDNEFVFILWFPLELIKILFNIETIIFYKFIDAIQHEKDSIDKMYQFIGEVDCAISTVSLKTENQTFCTPEFTTEKAIIVEAIRHPLIKNCITNDLSLVDNSLLISGSNMSGKTTFIRTIAINSILAQTLNICFAQRFSAPFLKLFSSLRVSDDLSENTSYYLQEVLNIKEFIDLSKEGTTSLFLLDEIFKGTNTTERIAGAKAILKYLNKGNNIVIAATHDLELNDLLANQNFSIHHFSETIEHNTLFFDHKLKKGKPTTRNAIKILALYNYPKEIIEEANKTVTNMEKLN